MVAVEVEIMTVKAADIAVTTEINAVMEEVAVDTTEIIAVKVADVAVMTEINAVEVEIITVEAADVAVITEINAVTDAIPPSKGVRGMFSNSLNTFVPCHAIVFAFLRVFAPLRENFFQTSNCNSCRIIIKSSTLNANKMLNYVFRRNKQSVSTYNIGITATLKNVALKQINYSQLNFLVMNTKQENIVSMWADTDSLLTTNNAVWTPLTAFASCVTRFRAKRNAINSYVAIQLSKTKGVTTDKATAKDLAIAQAVIISADVQIYAKDNSNNSLYSDMNFPKSNLQKLMDNVLLVAMQNIHDVASNNLAALANYGVTALKLSAFQTLIGNFGTFIPAPRNKKGAIKTATADLAQIIKDGNKELKSLDKLIGNFKATNADFVSSYFTARQIIDLGSPQTKVKGKVTDAVTGAVIGKAQIIDNTGAYKTKTAKTGMFSMSIPIGKHSFRCTAAGYQDGNVANFDVKKGQGNEVNFSMTH